MSQKQRFTRRRLLRASAASAAGLGAVGSANAIGGTDSVDVEELRNSLERVPQLEVRDETVPLEGGAPEQANGIRPGSMMFIEFEDGTAGCTANFIWRASGGSGGSGGSDDNGGNGGGDDNGPPDDPGQGNGKNDDEGDEDEDGDDEERRGHPEREAAAGDGDVDADSTGDGQLYIGAAGHCFLNDDADADEDAAREYEQGDDVSDRTVTICDECTFGGATGLVVAQGETFELGDVVYARQTSPEEEGGDQIGHDFGLVEVPEELEEYVDPSMPQFGGPLDVSEEALDEGTPVNQYGAGVGNGEVYPTMGSNGISFGDGGTDDEAWFAGIRASPGDSGSPLQSTTDGEPVQGEEAGGILTHLSSLGTAGTTIGRCKEMIQEDIGQTIELVLPD